MAEPSLTSVPPLTDVVSDAGDLPGGPARHRDRARAAEGPPLVVKVPVTLNAPLPWTVPETTRGLAMLWAVLTPRVPWTSSVPVPVTEPALRLSVVADTSRVPEASWIEPVLLAVR